MYCLHVRSRLRPSTENGTSSTSASPLAVDDLHGAVAIGPPSSKQIDYQAHACGSNAVPNRDHINAALFFFM